jgi:hypothetical protein
MIGFRIAVGLGARIVFWVMVWLIVGNAVAQAISDGAVFAAVLAVLLLPFTVFLYPFFAPDGAGAWPLADGSSLIAFLVVAAIAYPISTFVGGMDSV